MTIRGLHHVQITVPADRVAEARAFYCDVLGLIQIPKAESLQQRGGFWLKLGELELHIGVENGVDRSATKAHLAYQVDDVGSWRERVVAAGLKPLDSIPIPGFDRFEFRDPFGNRIEMIQASSHVIR